MDRYRIYAGLGGGFGGANWHTTEEFATEKEAIDFAFEVACEEYDSYCGMYGLRDHDQIMVEDQVSETEAKEIWLEERDDWLDYWVEKLEPGQPDSPEDD